MQRYNITSYKLDMSTIHIHIKAYIRLIKHYKHSMFIWILLNCVYIHYTYVCAVRLPLYQRTYLLMQPCYRMLNMFCWHTSVHNVVSHSHNSLHVNNCTWSHACLLPPQVVSIIQSQFATLFFLLRCFHQLFCTTINNSCTYNASNVPIRRCFLSYDLTGVT